MPSRGAGWPHPRCRERFWSTRLPADWLARLRRLECVALDANHEALTREVVEGAHREGFRVCTWTVNDPARVAQLGAWGVDTIITDAIDTIPASALDAA